MLRYLPILFALLMVVGCSNSLEPNYYGPGGALEPQPVVMTHQNPAFLPVTDRDFLWEQLVDVMADYFRIEREQRVRLVGDVLTEGRIDTFPVGGATLLEPQRHDSVGLYNRLESTIQSIQRRALVRVIPTQGGYLVDVAVFKELEDVLQPEHTTAGAATFRNDDSLIRVREAVDQGANHIGWIAQGRDLALEQRILADIHGRLGGLGAHAGY